MLETLTDEQDLLIETVEKEYINNVLSGDDSYNVQEIILGINFLYELIDLSQPEIVICPSPMDMAIEAGLKDGEKIDYIGNGYDSGWTAFYDYFQRIGINYSDSLFDKWRNFILKSGVFATVLYENVAFVCIRPNKIKRNSNDDLHADGETAIEWRDGYGEYYLNGISVPEELAILPSDKLNIELFKKETNADVRAEFIRKFGIERMISLGKSIQKWTDYNDDWFNQSEYELINMGQAYGVTYAPYLKMKNLTTGIYHLEGVHPNCKTIEQALNWRAKGKQIKIGGIK